MEINPVYLNPIAERLIRNIEEADCNNDGVADFLRRHLRESRVPYPLEAIFLAPILINEMEELLERSAGRKSNLPADLVALEALGEHLLALRLFQRIMLHHHSGFWI